MIFIPERYGCVFHINLIRMSIIFIVVYLSSAVCLISGCRVMFVLYCVLFVELVKDLTILAQNLGPKDRIATFRGLF